MSGTVVGHILNGSNRKHPSFSDSDPEYVAFRPAPSHNQSDSGAKHYASARSRGLCAASIVVNLEHMSICARTWYRGYRYYRFPNVSPGPAARA